MCSDPSNLRMAHEKTQIIRTTWTRFYGTIRMLVKSEQGPKATMFAGAG